MKKYTEEDLQNAYEFGEENDRSSLYNLLMRDEIKNSFSPDMSDEAIKTRKEELKTRTDIANKAWEDASNEGNDNEKSYWIHGFLCGNEY